jgi:ferritin-like protein
MEDPEAIDKIIEKVIYRDDYASYHFYWSSDESVKGFLEDLKEFFMEEGSERNR